MLTSVVGSCVRNGAKVSQRCSVTVSSMVPKSSGVRDFSSHRSLRIVTPALWTLTRALSGRSAASGTDPPPPLDPAPDPADRETTFGSLSADMSSRKWFKKDSPYLQELRHREDEEVQEEVQEEARERAERRPWRRNTPYWYFLQCKKLIKENKLQEALDVFSRDMLKGERLQPEESNYTVLIGGCARAGHLKRAFKLYNDMKKRGLEPSDPTYTALFNACAESPYKHVGLQQALKLEQELRRKNIPLSTITYHALLKTHAIANNLQSCLHTIREMLQNGHVVTQETFHYLLMACLKEKDTGFRLALQVWRQMLLSGIVPDSRNYTLLLRTARDCGIGDPALATTLLLTLDARRKTKAAESRLKPKSGHRDLIDIDVLERQLFLQPDPVSKSRDREEEEICSGEKSTSLIPVRQTVSLPVDLSEGSTTPNLLEMFEGKMGAVVSIGAVEGPSDRLALIGGAEGFLEKMSAEGLSPDLKTLTLLADTMDPGRGSLQTLLKVAKMHKVKLDVAFFNSVIRRAARAGDLEGGQAVLAVMKQRNINVDIQTFGCLALACDRQKDGLQLLKDMEEAGLKPNNHVFSALIGRASRRLDYVYLKTLIQRMSTMGVWPNEVIIKQLEFAAQYPPNYNQYKTRNNYLVQIDGFRGYYQQWLRDMPAAQDGEDDQQPDLSAAEVNPDSELTREQRNQRAAARRFNTRQKKMSSVAL